MFTIKLFFVILATAQAAYMNISVNAETLTQSQGVFFENTKINDHFGNSVSRADFNADGYPDVIIGSKGANSSVGIVYVIFGNKDGPQDLTISSGLTPSQALIIYGPNIGSQPQFGYTVSYAGDVNDDGIDDIMISAYGYQNLKGLVYVLYGSKNLPPVIHLHDGIDITQGFTILGVSISDLFGGSLSYAGDVNHDQIDDIIIGAAGFTGRTGAAYIIFGRKGTRPNITLTSSGLSSTEGFVVLGVTSWDAFGISVSRGGDLNGDGIDDVLIGASGVNNFFGAAYVIFGSKNDTYATIDLSQGLDPKHGIALTSGTSSSYLGSDVAGIGDFNGDGSNDFLLGAYRQDVSKGAVYVIFGGKGMTDVNVDSGLDSTKGFKITGSKNSDYFGYSFSDAGDYNGDGLNDILIGAPQASNSNGAAYLIFGSKEPVSNINVADGLSSQQGFAFTSPYSYDYLGCAIDNVGDMNQDGMDDLLIATYRGMTRPGAAYLFYTPLVCPSTCLTCTKRSICQTCKAGYGLVNSMCVSCPSSTSLVNGVCQPTSSPLTTTTEVAQGLFNSGSTTSRIFTMGRSLSVGLGLIAKIIQNVRFLNISYPQEAQTAFESYGTDLFELPIPDTFYKTPDTKSLPTQYSTYDISPTFVENYWQTIMTLLIILVFILVIKFLQKITRSQKKEHFLQIAFKKMNQTASNFLVIQIYSNLDDVIFFFLLDTSSTKLHSPSASFSLSLACCFLLLGLALVFLHCWVLSQYQKAKSQGSLERFRARFRILGTLFEDFKDDSTAKQSFFGILILRCVFLVLVIMLLRPPWIQASLLMLANLFFLAYLIYQRPFKNRFDEIMQYFCELTVFAAYLSVLVLSILDYKEDFTSSVRNGFGKCIVFAGIVLSLGGFIAQVIQTVGAIIEIYRFCKNYYRKSSVKISPTKLKIKPNKVSNEAKNQDKNFESSGSSSFILKNNKSQADNFDQLESIHTHHKSALISENSPEKFRRSMNDLQISSTSRILYEENFNAATSQIGLREDENIIKSLKIQRSQTQQGQLDEIDISPRINNSRKHKKFKRKQKLPDLEIQE